MAPGSFRFDTFHLDPGDRKLLQGDAPVELNARYLDALTLLVREAGKLVSKDRFLDEVWRGIPVTDEALTQCIKTLRRQLGDDAANPRFIETVPKHGYRFIAPVEAIAAVTPQPMSITRPIENVQLDPWQRVLMLGASGTIGGGMAGFIGGLIYGFAGASQPLAPGMGAVSVLLVLMCLTILVGVMGGAGVSFGIALAGRWRPDSGLWAVVGGAAGGFLVGTVVKLLGLDAFNLLLGKSPGDITGGAEGVLIGAAVGLGVWLAWRGGGAARLRRNMILSGVIGAAAAMLVVVIGGCMMSGSLALLSQSFPGSRLQLDQIGALLGENGFGPVSQIVTGGLEGGLFASCVVGAMILAERSFGRAGS